MQNKQIYEKEAHVLHENRIEIHGLQKKLRQRKRALNVALSMLEEYHTRHGPLQKENSHGVLVDDKVANFSRLYSVSSADETRNVYANSNGVYSNDSIEEEGSISDEDDLEDNEDMQVRTCFFVNLFLQSSIFCFSLGIGVSQANRFKRKRIPSKYEETLTDSLLHGNFNL